MELSDRATFLVEYLDLAVATGDPDARWEAFQIAHLNNPSLLGVTKKARQVGWSWMAAAEAVADSCLNPNLPNIFVSITQDEAAEKIRYARAIIEALDPEVRPRLIIDNRLELELANGSRLMSHPCRPVRGKAKANVYLDELAHYPKDREIYTAALPVTTKGGRLRIGSSPLGAGGLFWEIESQSLRPYPGYTHAFVPWWQVRALCGDVEQARQQAPGMATEARVRAFGAPRLVEIFENLPLEDFQQEYECAWVDESVAWISWDEIRRNQSADLLHWHAEGMDDALRLISDVAQACHEGRIEPALAGGMDVGRVRNATELAFVGKSQFTPAIPLRFTITLAGVAFDDQRAVIDKALSVLPVTTMLMDRNGLGMQLAEQAEAAHGVRAQGVNFTNETKELWAVEIKVQMQRGNVPIPLDRELAYQIHSIKKKRTEAKNAVFDTERNETHHADKFWALALALWAARGDQAARSFVMRYA